MGAKGGYSLVRVSTVSLLVEKFRKKLSNGNRKPSVYASLTSFTPSTL